LCQPSISRDRVRLDRVGARGHAAERTVHLRHVLKIECDVPLRQLGRAEAELAPSDAIIGNRALAFEMIKIGTGALGEFGVDDAPP
jgi:hypothetical protein